ncbi:putative fatty-acid--CoA ligase [Caenibius tardaugens NBRC 16725]|uniref:3-methylmercaptopropionyl-CoA ligase n=1 Tax=Caenibius tardaugens NBRC 16725 TaxID=1219035 RepID=U2YNQ9_9SPHN|nr:AMP-binding protein [Caenibius tardaugens]GAD50495.1 putative fatty-acid--CoA ligase [Caenibius tardaugens NBRC 16725]
MNRAETIRRERAILQARWKEQGYYNGTTLSEALTAAARAFPDTPSFYYRNEAMIARSNADLFEEGLRVAAGLYSLGVRAGDVIAVQLPTWLETAIIYQAIAHLGAITLPIVSIYGDAEISYIVQDSGAKFLFVPDAWRGRPYAARYAECLADTRLEALVVIGDAVPASCIAWDDLVAGGTEGFTPAPGDPNAIACLIYTSGTTSHPKGVQHTHNSLLWEWGRPTFANRGMYLSNMPAGHITGYGFVMRPSLYGAPQVFMDHWDPVLAARLIERHQIRCGGGTPTFLVTLLDAAQAHGADMSSLTSFSMGGQGITPEQVRMADERGFRGARVYGSTEHPTVTLFDPDETFQNRAFTDGQIDTGNEVRIVDDNDRDLPTGAEGNILTRGPDLFAGYSNPELDLEAFAPGGWFRTGDIGRLDGRGYLLITDRKKDIIIRGGENISSTEVEACLMQHPSVNDAAAVAMPDAIYGEKVCAFVVLEAGMHLTLADACAHFRNLGLSVQKTPERLEFLDELPRNASGKVKKNELRLRISQTLVQTLAQTHGENDV